MTTLSFFSHSASSKKQLMVLRVLLNTSLIANYDTKHATHLSTSKEQEKQDTDIWQ